MPSKRRSRKTVKKQKKSKSKNSIISSDVKTSEMHPLLESEDIIDILFSYLDYKTLCEVQHVCRFWQKKVHERLLKDYPPFFMDIPVLYCENNTHLLHNQLDCIEQNPTIKNLFMTLPNKTAIIFTDGQFSKQFFRVLICTSDNLDNVADDYLKFLPQESIAVDEFIYVDDIEIDGRNNKMTALFFPKTPAIQVKWSIVTTSRMKEKYFDYDDPLIELFELEDPKDKEYCILIFGLHCDDRLSESKRKRNTIFINEFLSFLKARSKSYKMTVWGAAHLEIRHWDIEPDSEANQWHIFNIIGIHTYSITLNLDLSEETFKEKLKDLKSKMTFKKNAIALAITHTKKSKKKEKDQIIKKILWFRDIFHIKLTTILAYVEDYSCDPIIFSSASDDANFKIDNKNHNQVAYLIISS